MKLLIQSAMIFFGTLMAAGVVALGEPAATAGYANAGTATPHSQPLASAVPSSSGR